MCRVSSARVAPGPANRRIHGPVGGFLMNVLKNSGKMLLGLAVVLGMSLASAAKAADTGTVSGKVLDKDGKGVSGAKVRLMADTGGGKKKGGDAPATLQAQGEK